MKFKKLHRSRSSQQSTAARGGDLSQPMTKSAPLRFHDIHSDNVQLIHDRRRAKRIESFCKGICFSHRPIAVHERVYLQFAEVSTSWSGVVRFGFTSHDPCTLNGSELPRYACPDLTNKPGYWAKALSERYSLDDFVLSFYVTRNGDVMFGVNGEEKGVFFSGVVTTSPLWGLVDIYGNTTAMEFVNGPQLNNMVVAPPAGAQDLNISTLSLNSTGGSQTAVKASSSSSLSNGTQSLGGILPIRFHTHVTFGPLPFHATKGRNVSLSSDRTIAARSVEEYCNAYVFTQRPLQAGERVVIQMLAVDHTFYGGMAFGLTACDPTTIDPDHLPDDADLLLDRPEYWVVNKDVSGKSETGDELSFHLTEDGEVRFGRNGHHITTLMHVDKTLPLWAFFDVYGYTQKIKCLGTVLRTNPPPPIPQHRSSVSSVSGLTVALPPPRVSTPTTPTTSTSAITPPPRPPPPRSSPGSRRGSTVSSASSQSPPLLPPKQHRPLPAQPPLPGMILTPQPVPGLQLGGSVPPLIRSGSLQHRPVPQPLPTPSQLPHHHHSIHGLPPAITPRDSASPPHPPVAPRNLPASPPAPSIPDRHLPVLLPKHVQDCAQENADNASNECSVCFEKAVDCVIYTCGHMCMCYECAMDIKENQGGLCPICRQPIKDLIKTFRS